MRSRLQSHSSYTAGFAKQPSKQEAAPLPLSLCITQYYCGSAGKFEVLTASTIHPVAHLCPANKLIIGLYSKTTYGRGALSLSNGYFWLPTDLLTIQSIRYYDKSANTSFFLLFLLCYQLYRRHSIKKVQLNLHQQV